MTAIHEEKFTHFVEINIDVDNLWSLFVTLSDRLLGDTAYGIIGFKDEKTTLSNFTKNKALELLVIPLKCAYLKEWAMYFLFN
ncbi:hypothetical protein [Neobacillus massiliamazoniensis]|uniref:Uncharacterized protein n=1 Tax=Neobacillus massiliamazoniensis TaxID=1499688 RepID=A0A0U1P498_9BACI|nr:hypothetical protein [Neobacillus massiliamazoniensis]CRK84902.1 hypothetical protein BN000_04961 [Neobacillus massiliamazoniensis]